MIFFLVEELTVTRAGTQRNAATESQRSHFLISFVTILVEVFSHPRGRRSQQSSCLQKTETEHLPTLGTQRSAGI